MKSFFTYTTACIWILGSLMPSTTAAGLFGSLLGDNNNNNNNNPNIPLIGALGLGSNIDEPNRPNNNYNSYANNNNQYTNNNNNQFTNNNANTGLLSVLGVNTNANRPNTNNLNSFNRYPNTGQNNPSTNTNDLKNQVKDAEKLLERLKELNRLKEQQKLDKEKENNQGQLNLHTEKIETDSSNVKNNGDSVNKGVLKSLTKKKFYFMVKPVLPENEADKYDQTVYYID